MELEDTYVISFLKFLKEDSFGDVDLSDKQKFFDNLWKRIDLSKSEEVIIDFLIKRKLWIV
jgi:hypothetical protein